MDVMRFGIVNNISVGIYLGFELGIEAVLV